MALWVLSGWLRCRHPPALAAGSCAEPNSASRATKVVFRLLVGVHAWPGAFSGEDGALQWCGRLTVTQPGTVCSRPRRVVEPCLRSGSGVLSRTRAALSTGRGHCRRGDHHQRNLGVVKQLA